MDSMFTSIGFVGMSSLNFRSSFSIGSFSKRDKKAATVFFSGNVRKGKTKLHEEIAGLPSGWRNHCFLEESGD